MTTITTPTRIVAEARDEDDYCERSTQSCAIDHSAERTAYGRNAENMGCEGW
jgi:hypothetical protein